MTEKYFFLIFTLAAVFPVFQIILCKFMHPIRIKLAKIGKELLLDESVSDEQKQFIEHMLDDAYDWRKAVILALFATPVSVYVIISKVIGADIGPPNSPFSQLRLTRRGNDFLDQYMLCMLGSNPLASFLAMVQILPVMIGLSIVLRGYRRAGSIIEEHVLGYVATAKRL